MNFSWFSRSYYCLFCNVKARSVASKPIIAKENIKVVPCTRYADQSNVSGLAYLISTDKVDAKDPKQ